MRLVYRALREGDESKEFLEFILLDYVAKYLSPRYKLSDHGRMYLYDRRFIREYETLETLPGSRWPADNYHSLDRKYMLHQLLKLIERVPGNTAECGSYRGASSYIICQKIRKQGRMHRVFDSFEGLSSPSAVDSNYFAKGYFAASEEVVRRTLAEFDFVTYHKGWIPDCFRGLEAERFALVHIDVDLYQPTIDSLRYVYPRMATGGVIICDDSGFPTLCPGARKAMDEFFVDKPEPIIEVPTGQSFVIKQ